MSLFNLDLEPSGTKSGVTDHYYSRVTPTSNGRIDSRTHMSKQTSQQLDFRFSPSGTDWWVPSKSYFRFRIRCRALQQGQTNADGGVYGPMLLGHPDPGKSPKDQRLGNEHYEAMSNLAGSAGSTEDWRLTREALSRIRPARGFCASLFDTASCKVGDTVVSKISDDLLHQIDVFKKRCYESTAFLNGSGNSTGLYATRDHFHSSTYRGQTDGSYKAEGKTVFDDGSIPQVAGFSTLAQIINGSNDPVRHNAGPFAPTQNLQDETKLSIRVQTGAGIGGHKELKITVGHTQGGGGAQEADGVADVRARIALVFNNVNAADGARKVFYVQTPAGNVYTFNKVLVDTASSANSTVISLTGDLKLDTTEGYSVAYPTIGAGNAVPGAGGGGGMDAFDTAIAAIGSFKVVWSAVNQSFENPGSGGLFAHSPLETYGADSRLRVLSSDMSSGWAEIMWQPPLGIFEYDRALPPSTYDLQLRTRPGNLLQYCLDWELFRFCENYSELTPGTPTGGYRSASEWVNLITADRTRNTLLDFGIEEIYFYAAIVQGPRADDVKYSLDIRETQCIARQLGSGSGVQTQNFDVHPNTANIAFAIQGKTAWFHGSDGEFRSGLRPFTLSSKINTYNVNPAVLKYPYGMYPMGSEARALRSWYVSYDGKQYPSEHSEQYVEGSGALAIDAKTGEFVDSKNNTFNSESNTTSKLYMTQRWFDTVSQNGTHYMSSGAETMQEWLGAGAYYYMTWPRQGTANATRLMLNLQTLDTKSSEKGVLQLYGGDDLDTPDARYSVGESVLSNQARILLFTQFNTSFLIVTKDSRVTLVETPQNSDAMFRSVGA